MAESPSNFKWRVIGKSVRGASHFRSQLPSQDAIRFSAGPSGAPPIILAVADGHGSPKCFRSEYGAKLAVVVAIRFVVEPFLQGMKDQPLSAIKNAAEKLVPADLVKMWRTVVNKHFQSHPFTEDELERVEKEAGPQARQSLTAAGQHYLAYGTTLLLAVVAESFIFYLQLGDGDILTVSDRTGKVESPMVHDAELMANETTSMCEDNAQRLFRFRFQPIQDSAPALILVSTDGYSNAFKSDEAFHQVGTDLLEILRKDGPDKVQGSLKGWLNEASDSGSGDDVTLGIICRLDAIVPRPESGLQSSVAAQPSSVETVAPAGAPSANTPSTSAPLPDAAPPHSADSSAVPTITTAQTSCRFDTENFLSAADEEVESILASVPVSHPEVADLPTMATRPACAARAGWFFHWWNPLSWFRKPRPAVT